MSKQNKGNGIYFETENATGWIFNKDFIPTGRIKRMRERRESRYVKPLNRLVKSLDIFDNSNIFYPITRWNRH